MTDKHTIKAERRDCFGKNEMHRLRAKGRIPAVVYGPTDGNTPIMVDNRELTQLLGRISVENTIVEVQVEGDKSYQTLIREVQKHPFRPELRHIDFYCVPTGRRVHVEVPVVLHGNPIGVRTQSGLLQHVLRDVTLSVLASDIPEQLVVDVTELHINESLHVSDLPKGNWEVLHEEDQTVVTVVAPTVTKAEAEEAAEAAASAEPEVIRRRETEEE